MSNLRLTRTELKWFQSLRRKKVRRAEGRFLLEGWHALDEAIAANAPLECIAVVPERSRDAERAAALATLRERGVPIKEATEDNLTVIAETMHSQGVVAVVRMVTTDVATILSLPASLVVALDEVGDPGNLGSVLRTCDWFGVAGVLLGKGCVELHNDKVVRATAGSLFHLPILEDVDLALALMAAKRAGFRIVMTAADGELTLPSLPRGPRTVVVLGSEAHGISTPVRARGDAVVRVPRFGMVESLNVAVTCGIVLAHLRLSALGSG
jgi:RNA methyltransferase, TrmH family